MTISKDDLDLTLEEVSEFIAWYRKNKKLSSRMVGVEQDVCRRLAKGLIVYYAQQKFDQDVDWRRELYITKAVELYKAAMGNQHLAVKYGDLSTLS